MYMINIFEMRKREAMHWDDIVASNSSSHLVVSTMDVFVKWRAGQLKGHTQQLLNRLQICLFCMEEFETFDLPQVVAALTNLPAKTLVMVSDINQRVETCGPGGRRATCEGRGSSAALSLNWLRMAKGMMQGQ